MLRLNGIISTVISFFFIGAIKYERDYNKLLDIEKTKQLEEFKSLVYSLDKKAFLMVHETKFVYNVIVIYFFNYFLII